MNPNQFVERASATDAAPAILHYSKLTQIYICHFYYGTHFKASTLNPGSQILNCRECRIYRMEISTNFPALDKQAPTSGT